VISNAVAPPGYHLRRSAVARLLGVESLTAEECGLGDGWIGETRLWYYVRKVSRSALG